MHFTHEPLTAWDVSLTLLLTRESNLQVFPDTLSFLSFSPTEICKYFVVVFGMSELLLWVGGRQKLG